MPAQPVFDESTFALLLVSIEEGWEDNESIDWSEAEQIHRNLTAMLARLPQITCDAMPICAEIAAYCDQNDEWDSGSIATMPMEIWKEMSNIDQLTYSPAAGRTDRWAILSYNLCGEETDLGFVKTERLAEQLLNSVAFDAPQPEIIESPDVIDASAFSCLCKEALDNKGDIERNSIETLLASCRALPPRALTLAPRLPLFTAAATHYVDNDGQLPSPELVTLLERVYEELSNPVQFTFEESEDKHWAVRSVCLNGDTEDLGTVKRKGMAIGLVESLTPGLSEKYNPNRTLRDMTSPEL